MKIQFLKEELNAVLMDHVRGMGISTSGKVFSVDFVKGSKGEGTVVEVSIDDGDTKPAAPAKTVTGAKRGRKPKVAKPEVAEAEAEAESDANAEAAAFKEAENACQILFEEAEEETTIGAMQTPDLPAKTTEAVNLFA